MKGIWEWGGVDGQIAYGMRLTQWKALASSSSLPSLLLDLPVLETAQRH